MKNNSKLILATLMVFALFALAGCSKEKTAITEPETLAEVETTTLATADVTDKPDETEETTGEPSAEPEEKTVEEMTTKEWIDSLAFDEGKFIIFNEDTGKREVLENGQEYVISETDTLALWKPENWEYYGLILSSSSAMSIKSGTKYGYLTANFNYDGVGEKTEVWTTFEDSNGNEVDVNVYLTREETSVEKTEEDLSNEEWVKSLNLEKPTFLVFNDTTGERKVLEDGQEYKILETDELAIWFPAGWMWNGENLMLYNSAEIKYDCLVYDMNLDSIGEKTEFTEKYKDIEGNEVPVTVYLTKAQTTE